MDDLTCLLTVSYVPVDIPPSFSAVSIALNSDVDLVSIPIILCRQEYLRILASLLMTVAWEQFCYFTLY